MLHHCGSDFSIRPFFHAITSEGGKNSWLQIEDDTTFKREVKVQNDITLDFTKTQCRNIIKNIFYHYEASETLPLYEKKTLLTLKELYVDRLGGNSYAELLLKEMDGWDIDYSKGHDE